ncbi:MAG: hypothetical protein ACJASN_000050 [Cyclobacteriaceae bacterium]|jgi:hypothetical protein
MRKYATYFMFILMLVSFSATAQLSIKKDKSENEGESKTSAFAEKMKAKAKNFNPMKSIGKLAGNLLTSTTDDLSAVSMRVIYADNLYPSEAGTIETEYFGFWEEGSSMAGVSFLKREGVGMNKIDGSVMIDGAETEHVANGFYGGPVAASAGTHTFEITTITGQKATFSTPSVEPIEIISINGVPKGQPVTIKIDEDLILELNHPEGGTEDFYVQVLGVVMGIKTFNDIGLFKSADRIVIPKEAFSNTSTPALKYIQGDNYLQVTRVKEIVEDVDGVGAAQVVSMSSDWTKITFEGEGETILGVGYDKNTAAVTNKYDDGFKTNFTKSNAFWSPPFSQAKKVAIASFVVRATELKQQQSSSSSSTVGNVTTKTTTTTTKTFPELPDAFWDALVAEAYQKFKTELESTLGVEVIGIEQTIAAQSYDNMFSVQDTVATEVVVKPYKNCKLLIPTQMSEILGSISTTFPADMPDVKLVRELGVDAIVSVTLDCRMAWEDGALSPMLSFKMAGDTNGWKVGPTVYGQGQISGSGQGISDSYKEGSDMMAQMNEIMNLDRVIELLGTSLKELKAQEGDIGYEKLWSLK